MKTIYKTPASQRQVEEQYKQFLQLWPTPNEQFHVPTSQGETFVIACGDERKPPLLLLHGALVNSAMWLGDIALWAKSFRIYAVDIIGEPGLSAPSRPPFDADAYALWLSDVLRGLQINRFSVVGISLGGWLALDYATRNPESVARMVLVCPSGVGRQKIGVLFKVVLLSLFGKWGKQKLRAAILGAVTSDESPAQRKFWDFLALLQESVRPRMDRLPIFTDESLARLSMPVLAIVGGKDALLDSHETKRRIEKLPGGEVLFYDDAGHFIPDQGHAIAAFLDGLR